MRVRRTEMLVVVLALTTALLSMLLLSPFWHHTVAHGQTFPVVAGYISTLALHGSIPFAWPFLIAGFMLRWLRPARSAFWWTVGMLFAAMVLQTFVTGAQFPSDAPLRSHFGFYSGFLSAPLLAALGFLIAHFTRAHHERTV